MVAVRKYQGFNFSVMQVVHTPVCDTEEGAKRFYSRKWENGL